MEILKVKDLSFTYPLCTSPAIRDISFDVKKGEFIAVCGSTGSGKSTLLRLLKRELAPLGECAGDVYYKNQSISNLSAGESSCSIGYVMQKPEQQIVTDKVWHELAFGLENMNVPQNVIARRVAEMASYFGIEDWFNRNVAELSGGQKQLLNLAAVMVMQPEVLILDEPTAQLDPIAASDFIATLRKLNRDLSLTIIITEHRLEDIIPICDRLMILDKGKLIDYAPPREVIEKLKDSSNLMNAMPAASRLYHAVGGKGKCPLDVREGREFITSSFKNDIRSLPKVNYVHSKQPALQLDNVYLRYERNLPDVLCGLDLTVYENEIYCILGGNGSGKSTTLSVSSALLKPYSGTVRVFGKKLKDYKNQSLYRECLTLLPQDVQTVFLRNTVREELEDSGSDTDSLPFDISHLLNKHPYDLSGGEQQLVALAKVLATKPKLLLLDEPTKGLDANVKLGLIDIMKKLKSQGITIVAVTHDVEFASLCADRCAMFFCGNVVSVGTPAEFFSENNFYTTSANKMSRDMYDRISTVEEAARICLLNGVKDGVKI